MMFWHPGATESKRQCLPASHPELMARFVKESSLARVELLPDIDHMDLEARHETLHMKGEPVMVQTVEGQNIASFVPRLFCLQIYMPLNNTHPNVPPPSKIDRSGVSNYAIILSFRGQVISNFGWRGVRGDYNSQG